MLILLGAVACSPRGDAQIPAAAAGAKLSLSLKRAAAPPLLSGPHFARLESSRAGRPPLPALRLGAVRFRDCAPRVRLAATSKSVNRRASFSAGEVAFEGTLFEFCHALGSDGGCLYLADCAAAISACFFFHGVARNGGALCVSGGRTTIVDTNFVKNSAKGRCGAILARDGDLALTKCRFVANRAGAAVGAFGCVAAALRLLQCLFYGNSAPAYGAFHLREASGVVIDCSFKDNTAASPEGTSLSVAANLDWLCVENSKFYDTANFSVGVSAASATRLVDLVFAAAPGHGIVVVADSDRQVAEIVNPRYNGVGMEPPPELPAGMLREVLGYREVEPPFAWRSLYVLIALFTVLISLLVIFIPIVILPSEENLGYTKQSVESAAKLVSEA
jgi:hypothetical protein